jgi:hypothetical protein
LASACALGPVLFLTLHDDRFALAAIAILINRRARLATRLLTLMLALLGVLVWIPRLIAHPNAHHVTARTTSPPAKNRIKSV